MRTGTLGWARSGAIALAVAAGLTGWSASASAAISTYTFTNLGASDFSNSLAINNNNGTSVEVVGTSDGQAVYSIGGRASSLAVLGGAGAPALSTALGVNDGGVVVGSFQPGSSIQAFYTTNSSPTSTLTALPTFGGTSGTANAVVGNSTTFEIVGQSVYSGGQSRAFSWTGTGGLTALTGDTSSTTGLGSSSVGATSAANGVNAGLIVGQATNAASDAHGFLYVPSKSKMYDLGTLSGGTTSNAAAINASGEIVGSSDEILPGDNEVTRAFVIASGYTVPAATGIPDESLFSGPSGMTDIGSLFSGGNSYGYAVNSAGIVVGSSDIDADGDQHAFIYDSAAVSPAMEDLNDYVTGLPAGWTLDSATGVNDFGDITGSADDGEGDTYAFVLAPSSAVPEPAMGMFVLAGVAVKSLGRRRRA